MYWLGRFYFTSWILFAALSEFVLTNNIRITVELDASKQAQLLQYLTQKKSPLEEAFFFMLLATCLGYQ